MKEIMRNGDNHGLLEIPPHGGELAGEGFRYPPTIPATANGPAPDN